MDMALEPLNENLDFGDRYRGNNNLAWTLKDGVTYLAARCGCGQWWGWDFNYPAMQKIVEDMVDNGCAKCDGS